MNDNDVYTGTDGDYSNGLQTTYLSRLVPEANDLEKGTHPARWVAEKLPILDKDHLRWGLGLGHAIYTPGNVFTPFRVTNDRPYAGWLYLGLSLVGYDGPEDGNDGSRLGGNGDVMESLSLDLGVVGPLAQGERVQNDWHTLIGDPETNGWPHQLGNEPGINLAYQRLWRFSFMDLPFPGLEADTMPRMGGAIGNIATQLTGGVSFRVGRNLAQDFGPPRIGANMPGCNFFSLGDGIGWYLFADAEGRVVFRDIFLDGNSFGGGHSLHKHPFVAEARFGAALTWKWLRLSFAHIYQSPQFEGGPSHRYGAITISFSVPF